MVRVVEEVGIYFSVFVRGLWVEIGIGEWFRSARRYFLVRYFFKDLGCSY